MLRKTKTAAAAVETKAEKAAPVEEKAAPVEAKVAPQVKVPQVKAAKAVKAPKAEKAPKVKVEKASKAEKVTEEVYLQYGGQEWALSDLKKKVNDAYAAEGHRAASVKKVTLYVKPEERKVYYVVNDKSMGSVDL